MTAEYPDSPSTRVPSSPGRQQGAGLSHTGHVRKRNEDAILTDPSGVLWAVADGMGGYGHGDVAADLVIEHLALLPHAPITSADLVGALEAANSAVRRWAISADVAQMGATVVAALLNGGTATLAWAGDSRAYRWRDRELLQLTRDHSVVQELLDDGRLSPNEAWQHPQAHIVTRAIGASDHLVVETTEVSFRPGDALILCSDGLTDCVADAEITALMNAVSTPAVACQRLISAALDNGAPDNVSVIVVQIDGAAIS
ncbi:serine/threonine-protein phosphatase (plasmid) [Rhizobium ruizarguesonis]|uniref:PP2C family protein-serine/threonine phosphatase n=1 Tax=Rhizobium ruizarguesonis TaxID=2081791 RepID=UPI00103245AF|nr:SpoIIE family protein phosphatase [Rhizobium ruizarguesonis]NEJ84964.1 SpoIIE family protein phosphatase [Rhizobium ruizarguesonis]TAT71950.1 serine/threonine-protein phosphatase [Rhizobium ruizarguesonis]TAT75604.1 serine/threonine-protein phosphatase [Rhizobium ruizarguesonis]TAY31018.1 serine/threonine-protein phosphatase [Rhizobium ruizarguesonis]TAY44800.1 serine/threonine-protein phosphatase [Rhizobium ruizarguesonis]